MNSPITAALLLAMVAGCAKPTDGKDGINGINGSQGPQGTPGEGTDIEVVTLCPNIAGSFPQVVWIMGTSVYAVVGSGNNKRLTKLPAGNYVTTDGRNCNFTVNADGSVTH